MRSGSRIGFTAMAMGATAMCMGGCPRPDDALEPNDTAETATRLTMGEPIEARVIQDNPDVFVVAAGPGQTLIFDLVSLGEEDCNSFKVVGPGGLTKYEDENHFCGRVGELPIVQPGGKLELLGEGAYRLTIHADAEGDYFLYVWERGHADNIFTYSWHYRLTVSAT